MAATKTITRLTHEETHYADGSVEMRATHDCNRLAYFHPNTSDYGRINDLGRVQFELCDWGSGRAYYCGNDHTGETGGNLARADALPLMRAWVKTIIREG